MSSFDAELAGLSSAEDFFVFFGLGFDPQIVAASRLHILKQFHDNLGVIAGLDTLPDDRKRAVYRDELSRAYQRFITGTALTERVFPKLAQAKGAFVALSSLRMPHKSAT
jgi:nitrogenase-stabilizing/protective protein